MNGIRKRREKENVNYRLTRLSVTELNMESEKRSIWLYGCGKRFHELTDLYANESFVRNSSCVIDGNRYLWGKDIAIGNRRLQVSSPKIINEKADENTVIVFMTDRYEEIYKSIVLDIKKRGCRVYAYPKYYSRCYEKLLRVFCGMPCRRLLLFRAGNEPHENADEIIYYLTHEYGGREYKTVYLDEYWGSKDGVIHIDSQTLRIKSRPWRILKYIWYYSGAICLFYENEGIQKIRSEQRLIYLNHGTIPLKYVRDVLSQSKDIDYAVCPGKGCSELYEKQYAIPKEKQIFMMPARVNAMLRAARCHTETKQRKKMILWLPTFRGLLDSTREDSCNHNALGIISGDKEWDCLDSELQNKDIQLVIKQHPRERFDLQKPHQYQNIMIITEQFMVEKKLSLQKLLAEAMAMITDYSGIAFEYMLMDRPIGYIVNDYTDYKRGFSVEDPFEYMPGEKISEFSQLLQFIRQVDTTEDAFHEERQSLVNRLFGEGAGDNGAKELVSWLDCHITRRRGKTVWT